jgi:predicted RNA-binding Zn-ribbon protein involved in translation (DUF1610 family)
MMTPLDDVKPGMYVAVAGSRSIEAAPDYSMGLFGVAIAKSSHYGGEPLEVLAVSLPFVCVTDGNKRYALDVRDVDLQKLDRKYVREMTANLSRPDSIQERIRKRTSKADPSECPRCGHKCVQRLTKPGSGQWDLHCPQCGLNEQPAPVHAD